MPWARSFCPFRACGAKLAKLEKLKTSSLFAAGFKRLEL